MEQYKNYFEKIKKLFAGTYESAGGQEFRFFHSVNVANITALLANRIEISEEERDIAVIASIFHDVAKYLRTQNGGFLDASHAYEQSNNLESHEQKSSEMIVDLLSNTIPKEKIKKVQETIANHGKPSTIPEKLLHDADELSEMGSMNIWKMSTYSAYKKRDVLNTIKYWFGTDRARHIEKTANLFLDQSKEEAARRIKLVDDILNDIERQLKFK